MGSTVDIKMFSICNELHVLKGHRPISNATWLQVLTSHTALALRQMATKIKGVCQEASKTEEVAS